LPDRPDLRDLPEVPGLPRAGVWDRWAHAVGRGRPTGPTLTQPTGLSVLPAPTLWALRSQTPQKLYFTFSCAVRVGPPFRIERRIRNVAGSRRSARPLVVGVFKIAGVVTLKRLTGACSPRPPGSRHRSRP